MYKIKRIIAILIIIGIIFNVFSIKSYSTDTEESTDSNQSTDVHENTENGDDNAESNERNSEDQQTESVQTQEVEQTEPSSEKQTTTSTSTNTKTSTTVKNTTVDTNKLNENKKDTEVLLKSLTVTGYEINFDSNKTEYSIEIPNEENSIEINAKAKSEKASVKISECNDLKVGENDIKVTVTAEDESTKEYIVKVIRKDEIPVITIDKLDKAIQNTTKDTITLIIDNVEITDEIFEKIKNSEKNFIFESIKENVVQYEWTINSENLKKISRYKSVNRNF